MYSLTWTWQIPDISKKPQKNGSFQFCSMWINNYQILRSRKLQKFL